jgi:hypothetical protein
MLRWPPKATRALVELFRPLQDLEVYVEDIDDEVFYSTLLNRIAPAGVRVKRVFAKGGRKAVVESAQSHPFHERRALFLVDGDLDWVRGDAPPPSVYRLDAYCVENLLLDEAPIVQVISEEASVNEADARQVLRFSDWEREMDQLVELFVAFAVLNDVDPSEQTVAIGVGPLLTQGKRKSPPSLDPAKLRTLVAATIAKIEAIVGNPAASIRLGNVRIRLNDLQRRIDAVSGKTFLFPFFEFHFMACTSRSCHRRSIRFRLAKHADPGRFVGLAAALKRAASGQAP